MSVLIGQVSYAPNNELRTKRLEAAHYQIEWLHKLLPNVDIISVAQAYNESDYVDNVIYRKYPEPIGAGKARNIILEEFYHADDDWLFLWDDDTVLYEHYSPEKFLYDIFNNEEKFRLVDAVSALEPEYYPYKKLNYEDKANLTHYKFEPRVLNSGSATSIIRNIKKYYNKEIYYPDIDANKGEGREDMTFLFEWLKQGLNWYTMQTMIRKSLCFDKSSIFGSDTKKRDAILMKDLDVMCEKYAKDGLVRGVKGKINWKAFNAKYNKSEKVLYIPREEPIEYTDSTTPKQKRISKTLF